MGCPRLKKNPALYGLSFGRFLPNRSPHRNQEISKSPASRTIIVLRYKKKKNPFPEPIKYPHYCVYRTRFFFFFWIMIIYCSGLTGKTIAFYSDQPVAKTPREWNIFFPPAPGPGQLAEPPLNLLPVSRAPFDGLNHIISDISRDLVRISHMLRSRFLSSVPVFREGLGDVISRCPPPLRFLGASSI